MQRFLITAGVALVGLSLLFYFSSAETSINAMINDTSTIEESPHTSTLEFVVRAVNVLIGVAGLILAALGFRARQD